MSASRIASLGGVLGGLVWIAAAVLGWGGDAPTPVFVAGLALFLLTFAALGYSLVASAPVWLRLVVMVATPALAYMVWITIDAVFPTDHVPVLMVGIVLVAAGLIGMGRAREAAPPAPVRGRRAAR